ncbi:Response regulator rcp1 [Phycisphaerae bacterium RAS1]|nr:Response regulator rcp1 [Phycisphaerae bacterium RAS1]
MTRRTLEESAFETELRIVTNGESALDYLHRRGAYADARTAPRPDLVLLDLNMPRIDGKRVLEEMRACDDLCRIPVVILTTSQQEEDILRSYDLGCNSFVTKPIEIENFMKTVRGMGTYWLELVLLPPH